MIFISLISGATLGFLYKGTRLRHWADSMATMMVLLLVGLMGLSLGSNQEITSNFLGIGVRALVLASLSILGSIAAVLTLTKVFDKG